MAVTTRKNHAAEMRRSYISYTFLLSFVAAMFFLQWKQEVVFSPILWIALLFLLLVTIAALFSNTRTLGLFGLCAVMGIAIACGSVALTTHRTLPQSIERFANGKRLLVRGIVSDQPDRRPNAMFYTLRVELLQTASGKILPVTGNLLIKTRNPWPILRYGDRVLAAGIISKPSKVFGSDFHYDLYLSLFDTYAVMNYATVQNVSGGHRSVILAALYALKEQFEARIERIFPEPHASFLEGLLTGSRRGIPQHLMDDFNATGLSHIVAISGYNVTVVLIAVSSLLFWLPLRLRFIPSLTALLAFTLLVGAGASVVRAAIMGTMGLLALQLGRRAEMRLTILWTAFFMLAVNPRHLWWDASFQLSFLAVIGISEAKPIIEWLTKRVPTIFGIRDGLQVTLSAQLLSTPWIMLLFGRISLIAPLANLLVLPLLPFAMLLGFLGVTVSFLSWPLGQIISYGTWGILQSIILIVQFFAHLPFAALSIKTGPSFVATYYVILAVILWIITWKKTSLPIQ